MRASLLRTFLIVSLFSVGLIGCGGSQETVAEDELVTDTGVTEETPQEEPKQEEQAPADEQKPVEQPAQQSQPAQEQTSQEGPSKEQLQNELDAIKSENVQLKEENSTLQQTNKDLANKISDLEAANAALTRAPKRTESAKVDHRPAAPGRSSSEEVKAYEGAINLAKNRNYRDAISELQTLLNTGIKEDYADNCQYWIGESNFHLKEYSKAIEHLEQVQKYNFSEKKDDAQLMIAQCYERLGDKDKARAGYQKLVDLYPTSEYVKRAKAKLN
ncbi:MAG: tetratricopeptide repeat protein [Bacteroidota bacterium]